MNAKKAKAMRRAAKQIEWHPQAVKKLTRKAKAIYQKERAQ